MSAEVLRRAAERMRVDAYACGDETTDFIPTVAAWLDRVAGPVGLAQGNGLSGEAYDLPEALAVARAYLGESA